jgi:hypothetical protein
MQKGRKITVLMGLYPDDKSGFLKQTGRIVLTVGMIIILVALPHWIIAELSGLIWWPIIPIVTVASLLTSHLIVDGFLVDA